MAMGRRNLYKLHLSFEQEGAAVGRTGGEIRRSQDYLRGAGLGEPDQFP